MNTPAKKLLAMLEDETTVESLPAGEVRDDLASLGVDPSGAVAFAHALAGSTGSPGGQLLGAIAAAEDAEAEIARIESADIGDVRAQIPEGAAAAIAAQARRTAGADSNVVGIAPRRRGRALRWGGPLAGIAASLLLVFVVGQSYFLGEKEFSRVAMLEKEAVPAERLDRAPPPAADAVLEDRVAGLPLMEAQKAPVKSRERSFGGAGGDVPAIVAPEKARRELAYKSLSDADDSRDKTAAAAPEAEPDSTIGLMAKREGFRAAPAAPPVAAPVTPGPVPTEGFSADTAGEKKFDGGAVVAAKPAPTGGLLSAEETLETDTLARARVDAPRIAAVFLVDRGQAPASMRNQALPAGALAGRLEEARMLAGGRPVIALYTVESSAGRQDYAQVPLMPAGTQQMPAPAPLTGLLGPEAARFDFIALP